MKRTFFLLLLLITLSFVPAFAQRKPPGFRSLSHFGIDVNENCATACLQRDNFSTATQLQSNFLPEDL